MTTPDVDTEITFEDLEAMIPMGMGIVDGARFAATMAQMDETSVETLVTGIARVVAERDPIEITIRVGDRTWRGRVK